MGPHLLGLLKKYKTADAMCADLLDQHPAGWSAVESASDNGAILFFIGLATGLQTFRP
jgi:hypothetical protein